MYYHDHELSFQVHVLHQKHTFEERGEYLTFYPQILPLFRNCLPKNIFVYIYVIYLRST